MDRNSNLDQSNETPVLSLREEEKDYTINLDDTTFKSPMIPKKSPNFLQED